MLSIAIIFKLIRLLNVIAMQKLSELTLEAMKDAHGKSVQVVSFLDYPDTKTTISACADTICKRWTFHSAGRSDPLELQIHSILMSSKMCLEQCCREVQLSSQASMT